jgi:hypothetical protein
MAWASGGCPRRPPGPGNTDNQRRATSASLRLATQAGHPLRLRAQNNMEMVGHDRGGVRSFVRFRSFVVDTHFIVRCCRSL